MFSVFYLSLESEGWVLLLEENNIFFIVNLYIFFNHILLIYMSIVSPSVTIFFIRHLLLVIFAFVPQEINHIESVQYGQ